MKQLSTLTEAERASTSGGAAGDDSLARDLGQFVGGYYGYMFRHPFLSSLPIVGGLFPNAAGLWAAIQ